MLWATSFELFAHSTSAHSQLNTMSKIKITQTRSTIRKTANQKRTIEALGLGKLHRSVEHEDTPQIRGMIRKVLHLVEVQEA